MVLAVPWNSLLPCRSCGVKQGCDDCGGNGDFTIQNVSTEMLFSVGAVTDVFNPFSSRAAIVDVTVMKCVVGFLVERSWYRQKLLRKRSFPKPVPDAAAARSARRFPNSGKRRLRSYQSQQRNLEAGTATGSRSADLAALQPAWLNRTIAPATQEVVRTGYTPTRRWKQGSRGNR